MAGNNDDPFILLVALGLLFGLFAWLIWHMFGVQLLEAMRYLRMIELAPLTLFDSQASACYDWLRIAGIRQDIPSGKVILASYACFGSSLRTLDPEIATDYYNLSGSSLGAIGLLAGRYYRWLLLAAGLGLCYHSMFLNKRTKFNTRYNLESFIKIQAKTWPVIAPFVNFNPAKFSARIPGSRVPNKIPLFAEALSPEEWLSYHQISVSGGVPERDRVRRALQSQLGPKWNGFGDLPPYIMLLMAAFALKGAQKREESDGFLGRLSLCWTHKGGFKPSSELIAEAKKILKDPEIGGLAKEIADQHAFRTTAFLGVLKWARFMGGVLASAQFLWLRGVDRTLWYAANNLGRRSFHTEGAGAMAHFMAEDAAQKALPIPRLDTAIIAINKYLADNQPRIPPREKVG